MTSRYARRSSSCSSSRRSSACGPALGGDLGVRPFLVLIDGAAEQGVERLEVDELRGRREIGGGMPDERLAHEGDERGLAPAPRRLDADGQRAASAAASSAAPGRRPAARRRGGSNSAAWSPPQRCLDEGGDLASPTLLAPLQIGRSSCAARGRRRWSRRAAGPSSKPLIAIDLGYRSVFPRVSANRTSPCWCDGSVFPGSLALSAGDPLDGDLGLPLPSTNGDPCSVPSASRHPVASVAVVDRSSWGS